MTIFITCHDQNMEGSSSKEEQPTGIKRGKKPKLTVVDIDQQNLDSLKEIGEENGGDK